MVRLMNYVNIIRLSEPKVHYTLLFKRITLTESKITLILLFLYFFLNIGDLLLQ